MENVNCNICGSADYQVEYRVNAEKYHPTYLEAVSIVGPDPPSEFTVVQCRQCGLLYLNPRYDAGELAAVYPAEQYTSRLGCLSGAILFRRVGEIPQVEFRGESIDSAKNRARLAEIRRHKESGRILDVGCNNGSFLALLEREGWETYGVDFSQTAIDNARTVFAQERTFCGDLITAAYPDAYFDVVTLYNTIEHLPNPGQVLQEVSRICKPSALVVIQTIDFDSLNARLFPRSLIFPAQHLYYFRGRDLRECMGQLGFKLAASKYDSIGLLHFGFYLAMYWWTEAMVAIHRRERGRLAESCRYLLEKYGIIHREKEMLRRMKMVGANNMPAIHADNTFYFVESMERVAKGVKMESSGVGVEV